MKRIEFLKKLGLGIGVIAIAPKVLAEMPAKESNIPTLISDDFFRFKINDCVIMNGKQYFVTCRHKFPWEEEWIFTLTPFDMNDGVVELAESESLKWRVVAKANWK